MREKGRKAGRKEERKKEKRRKEGREGRKTTNHPKSSQKNFKANYIFGKHYI